MRARWTKRSRVRWTLGTDRAAYGVVWYDGARWNWTYGYHQGAARSADLAIKAVNAVRSKPVIYDSASRETLPDAIGWGLA